MQRYPRDLSGGQRQRVGIMRALMLDPPLLLLDEPLGALDPITRYELQEELKRIFAALGKTVVLVTHDMHRGGVFRRIDIVLMREGRVVQRGTRPTLLERPAEPFVREFHARPAGAGAPGTVNMAAARQTMVKAARMHSRGTMSPITLVRGSSQCSFVVLPTFASCWHRDA